MTKHYLPIGTFLLVQILFFSRELSAKEYTIENFTTLNGLSQNDVHSIYQDSEGFIWAATNDKSACERLTNLLYLTEKPVEALYILNTMANIVIQSDSFSFKIDMQKVDSKVKSHPLVHKRLLYVSNPSQFTSF